MGFLGHFPSLSLYLSTMLIIQALTQASDNPKIIMGWGGQNHVFISLCRLVFMRSILRKHYPGA